ncbi:MAG: tetratricopeptide repeat protein [Synergistaceae bacterium]|nr:tetratricopeptide repeat protein [Synergistaceae bacterium]
MFKKVKANISAGEDIQVLSYYGIGGIGKTSLLRRLMSEMDDEIKRPLYVYVDLNIRQEPLSVLDSLRNILTEKYNFNFPVFDLAVYVYSKKIGEKIHEDTTEGLIEKSPFLSTVMDVLDEIPFVGILKKLDKCAGYVKNIIDKKKREVTSIDADPVDVIYKKLPYYFALDLSDNLEDTDTPLVVFMDTYEVLVNEMSGAGEPVNNDLWVRGENGLVQNSSRVMWVIAGREKLRWAEINSDWSDSLEQHILGNLSKQDAYSFLNSAGIYDEKLTDAIYNLTSGTPVFLDLCVDNYYSIIERGKTPEIGDFKGNTTVIIERFLRYMDDNRKDIIYLLSCIKIWDDEIFHDIAGKVLSGFSFTTYDKIKGASFITKGNDGTYTMHQTVQNVIYSNCPSFIREKAQEALNQYYENALKNTGVISSKFSVILPRYVSYLVRTAYSENEFSEIYTKLRERLFEVQRACQFDLLLSCMNELKEYALRNMPDTSITARLYNDIAKDLEAAGLYNEALEKAKRAEEMYRKFYGKTGEKTLNATITVSRCLRSLGKYEVAVEVLEKLYLLVVSELGEDNDLTIDLIVELGSKYYWLGQYHTALNLLEKALEKRQNKNQNIWNVKWHLANTYDALGKYQQAIEIRKEIAEKQEKVCGENGLNTINAMNKLVLSYYKVGQYNEAVKLGQKVLKKYTELLGENHPLTLNAMSNLSLLYSRIGQYQKSLNLGQIALERRIEILGEDHPLTLYPLNNMAICYDYLGQNELALELREKVLEKRIKIFGEKNPETLTAMSNLAETHNKMGNYDVALSLTRKAIDTFEKQLGKEHECTADTMNNLSGALSGLGRHDEAIKVQKEACEISERLLGEQNPRTIERLEALATRLKAAGKTDEAAEVEARLKTLSEQSQEQAQV